ncbi:MAG: preprotein translocase subunit SecG [Candidatus Tumulicola sp.]
MISLILAAAGAAPISKTSPPVPLPVQQQLTQPAAPAIVPHTAIALHAPWLTHTVAGIFMIAAVGLVALLAVQTTKQEGLSGTIGGRVESAYHGRLGAEEQLKRLTGIVAVVFVVSAFVLALTGI